ncbi:hypothetical protein CGLO_15011 [Colletotrichum gloeosporioides Cg-14]|uniref:Uncharacterized protein n=1 Tax=Colletotrichum gloeosporioides (strain Cg-14) TaxID=1237896 RepID=T0JZR3_COLGC|nr:hypothetical protein CGLO_15011 [Colletotrichum gloeosporioides Cg-14]
MFKRRFTVGAGDVVPPR